MTVPDTKKATDGPPIGSVIEPLRKALAATWAFYVQSQTFHWNVEGPEFLPLHEFFGQLYRDAQWTTDDLAERLRTLGTKAPTSPEEIGKDSGITFADTVPDAKGMTEKLAGDNERVVAALDEAWKTAEAAGEAGIANTLQGRIDQHKKWGWMLKALLSKATIEDIAKRPRNERLGELLGKTTKGDDDDEG
jgi:starvation-inducible DNA-binding protein